MWHSINVSIIIILFVTLWCQQNSACHLKCIFTFPIPTYYCFKTFPELPVTDFLTEFLDDLHCSVIMAYFLQCTWLWLFSAYWVSKHCLVWVIEDTGYCWKSFQVRSLSALMLVKMQRLQVIMSVCRNFVCCKYLIRDWKVIGKGKDRESACR